MVRCLLVFGEMKAQEKWSYATDNNPGQQKQLFLPTARSGPLKRKTAVERIQVNFFKRCKLINYERIGKSPRINDIHKKIIYVEYPWLKCIWPEKKKRERERVTFNDQIILVSTISGILYTPVWWSIIRDKRNFLNIPLQECACLL